MWVAVGDRYGTNSDPTYWSDDGKSWAQQN